MLAGMANPQTLAVDENLTLLVAIFLKLGKVEITDDELAAAATLVAAHGVTINCVHTADGGVYGPTKPG